jgi:hypothetical protein
MTITYLEPGEFVEIISYDAFITGIGLSFAGGIVRLTADSSSTWTGLLVSAGILGTIGLLLWRLSSSIDKRLD